MRVNRTIAQIKLKFIFLNAERNESERFEEPSHGKLTTPNVVRAASPATRNHTHRKGVQYAMILIIRADKSTAYTVIGSESRRVS